MEWPVARLGQLCDIAIGATPARNRPEYWGGVHVWVTVGELNGGVVTDSREHITDEGVANSSSKLIPAGTLLFSFKLSIGKMAFAGVDLYTNEAIAALQIRRRSVLDPRYLYYCLSSIDTLGNVDVAAKGKVLNKSKLRDLLIPLPPLSEQRRIVEILDRADRLRRLRAEADAKGDGILPALFIKMFGDPATNPMGWPVMPVGECLAPISRRDPSDRPDEPFTYIDIAGIDGKSGAICDTKELLGADAPSRARQVIKAGDILVSTVRPYLRATAMVPASLDGQVCSTGFCVLRPRVTYLRGYLYTLTRTTWFTDQLMARTRGASYPAVTDRDILELRVPLPSDPSLLERFDSLIETLIEQRARAGKCRTAVDQLFGNLLCRAFDGSLTASWREAHMKELLQEMEQQAKALEATNV